MLRLSLYVTSLDRKENKETIGRRPNLLVRFTFVLFLSLLTNLIQKGSERFGNIFLLYNLWVMNVIIFTSDA